MGSRNKLTGAAVEEDWSELTLCFLRMFPVHEKTMKHTVSLFDPLAFAPRIKARSLIICDASERQYVEPVANRISGECQIEFLTGRGFLDHENEDIWLKKTVGI